MDQQGHIFIPLDIRRAMGLKAGGAVEFFINDYGQAAFRAAKPKRNK
ncbi:AbrB/MazE/SpoVT family DNA-binding domain-containing protein [Sphingobium sp. MK2]